ncbi:hypothetical protein D3C74_386840 [compost metagenome]
MTMTRASCERARAMDTICLPAADSSPTSRWGEISGCPSRLMSARVFLATRRRLEKPTVDSSCPR